MRKTAPRSSPWLSWPRLYQFLTRWARPRRRAAASVGLRLEALEDRCTPATFTVNSLGDTGAGVGLSGDLRYCLIQANAAGGADTINFAVTGTINLSSTLAVTDDLTIDGPGADQMTLAGNGSFTILQCLTAGVDVAADDLTITGGSPGILFADAGTLTLDGIALRGNSGSGVAVSRSAGLSMTGCEVSGNAGFDGAVVIDGAAASLVNTTVSGNTGVASLRLNSQSGLSSSATVTNCTFAGNSTSVRLVDRGSTAALTLHNTILADLEGIDRINSGGTITVTSLGNNLVSDGSLGADAVASDLQNTEALLSPLGDYGGPTQTHALLPGSPAIDAAHTASAPAQDQRGIGRVGAADIGAFESRKFTQSVQGGNNQSTRVGTAFPAPLTVHMTSAFDEPVEGGRITLTPPASGASATLAQNPMVIDSAGNAATAATANGTAGSYSVTATADGVTNAVSFSLTNTAGTTVVVTTDPTVTFSASTQTVTLRATVTSAQGTPDAGTVTFAVPGAGADVTANVVNGVATATFTVNGGVLPGSYEVTASYSGAGLFEASASSGAGNGVLTVTPPLPTLNISDVTQVEGDSPGTTTFIFTVTLTAPAPPGGVTFDIATADGTAQDDNPAAEDNDYVAQSLTGQSIPAGSTGPFNFSVTVNRDSVAEPNETFIVNVTSITGAIAGDTQGQGTISNDDVAPTITSANSATFTVGVAGTFTITTTGNPAITLAGTLPGGVTFTDNGNGTASLAGTPTASGTFTLTITASNGIAPDAVQNFTLTVNQASTTIVTSNVTTTFSTSTQNVTLTADVSSDADTVNEGTVTFTVLQGTTVIGTATTSGTVSNGVASVTYVLPASTAAGTYTIEAVYNDSTNFTGSSDTTHTLTVNAAATTTAVTTSPTVTFSRAKRAVTLRTRVSSAGRAVTVGTVTFAVPGVGAKVSARVNAAGVATATFIVNGGVPPRKYMVVATYNAAGGFAGSVGRGVLTVRPAPASSPYLYVVPGASPQQVTFTYMASDTAYRNQLGFTIVDGSGAVNGVQPGTPGYAQAVLRGGRIVFDARVHRPGDSRSFLLRPGQLLLLFLIQNGTRRQALSPNPQNLLGGQPLMFFALPGANPDSFRHMRRRNLAGGGAEMRWEDLTGGGDQDFNDVVVRITSRPA